MSWGLAQLEQYFPSMHQNHNCNRKWDFLVFKAGFYTTIWYYMYIDMLSTHFYATFIITLFGTLTFSGKPLSIGCDLTTDQKCIYEQSSQTLAYPKLMIPIQEENLSLTSDLLHGYFPYVIQPFLPRTRYNPEYHFVQLCGWGSLSLCCTYSVPFLSVWVGADV